VIEARGESPTPLSVEPGGAEYAKPLKRFSSSRGEASPPDPGGRVARDSEGLIQIEAIVVPSTKGDSDAVRVHLVFRPNKNRKAHWNNEAEGLLVWLNPPSGWKAGQGLIEVPNDRGAVSDRPRLVEFELQRDRDKAKADREVDGYALYYACEDEDGVCVYRRQDFSVKIR